VPVFAILNFVAQLADIVVGFTAKNPSTAPHFAPLFGTLTGIASRVAGETPTETAKRLADHDAAVRRFAEAPPGAKEILAS